MIATEVSRREHLIKLALCCDLARLFRACVHAEKRLGRVPDVDALIPEDLAAVSDTPLSKDEVNRVARAFSFKALWEGAPKEFRTRAEQTADRMLTRSQGAD